MTEAPPFTPGRPMMDASPLPPGPPPRPGPPVRRCLMIGLVVGLLGAAALWTCTPFGLGMSHDSGIYVESARRFNAGEGLSILAGSGRSVPMTHFPPLYPLLLAVGDRIGPGINPTARAFGVAVLVTLAALAAVVVGRYARSVWAALAVAALVVVAPDVLRAHTWAWTEPPFLAAWLGASGLLCVHLQRPRWSYLIGVAVLVAIAFLSRYVGGAIVAAMCLAILLWQPGTLWRRLIDCAVLSAIACGPVAAWVVRNKMALGTATNREVGFNPLTLAHGKQLAEALAGYIWPFVEASPVSELSDAVLVLGIVTPLLVAGLIALHRLRPRSPGENDRPLRRLPDFLLLFAAVYFVLVVASLLFADPAIRLDARILLPAYLSAGLACVCMGFDLLPRGRPMLAHAAVLTLAISYLLVTYSVVSVWWLDDVRRNGLGFNERKYVRSPLWAAIDALPADASMYSNDISLLRYYTSRPVWSVKESAEAWALAVQKKPEVSEELARMRRRLSDDGYFIYFAHRARRFPREHQVVKFLGLQAVATDEIGTLYLRPAPSRPRPSPTTTTAD